jgi:ABC-2 type transport system permease protein
VVTALSIARTELTRLFRDRANLFFVFVFPLLLVVLIGASFGGSMESRIGVVLPSGDGPARQLAARIEAAEGIVAVVVEDAERLRGDVARGSLRAGVVLPDGFETALTSQDPVEVGFIARPDTASLSLRAVIDAAVADVAATAGAARTAAAFTGGDAAAILPIAEGLRRTLPGVEVVVERIGGDELAREFAGLGQFDLGASSQLFLFTFLTALSGGSALIQTRQYGVAKRMLSTATPMRTIVAGEAGGRILVALLQAGYIIVATVLLFRVDWGEPLATAAVVLLFCLVSGGAGLLLGSVARNDSQASGIGVGVGLAMAALGGSMVPLEVFPEAMRTVALITPHAWANTAMAEIVRREGGLADIASELAVLAVYAAVLLGLAGWRLQRTLTR